MASIESRLSSMIPRKLLRRVSSQSALLQARGDNTQPLPSYEQLPGRNVSGSNGLNISNGYQNGISHNANTSIASSNSESIVYQRQRSNPRTPSTDSSGNSPTTTSPGSYTSSPQTTPTSPISSTYDVQLSKTRRPLTIHENVGFEKKDASMLPKYMVRDASLYGIFNKVPTISDDELPYPPDGYQSALALLEVLVAVYSELCELAKAIDFSAVDHVLVQHVTDLEILFRKTIYGGDAVRTIDAVMLQAPKRDALSVDEQVRECAVEAINI